MENKVDRLDNAFLFALSSIGLLISFMQIRQETVSGLIEAIPFLLLDIALPFYVGYMRGAIEKASCLLCELNKLHPFFAGNKRTAYEAAAVMLLNNGYVLSAGRKQGVAVSYGLGGCYICWEQVTKWLRKNVKRAISH